MPEVDQFLRKCRQIGASDLHISAGQSPAIRHNGILKKVKYPPFEPEHVERMVHEILSDEQWQTLQTEWELDLAYIVPDVGRCRTCVCTHHAGLDVVFRLIPEEIPTLDQLGMPSVVKKLLEYRQGMVLVTGQAGCGKTTTLAAMINHLNHDRRDHIICLEDPIEFVHESHMCHIIQREVGPHTESFGRALRACLREDPDVILIGEMRDLETISQAITAAETGHLVLATLHTMGAPRTIMRVMDVFPPNQQDQIRTMLAESLRGIISQQLLPTVDETGRVVATEVLICTPAVAHLIREDRTFQIPSQMQVGIKLGMRLMDDSIMTLLQRNQITPEVAVENAQDPHKFRNLEALHTEQINWDEFITLSERDKRRALLHKGIVLMDRVSKMAKPFNRDQVPFRFYQSQRGKLPEDVIYAEIVRLFPGAGREPEDAQGLPGGGA